MEKKTIEIKAGNLHYKKLNEKIHQAIKKGFERIVLKEVYGQRYIGDGVKENIEIIIKGTAGNDLAAFADGVKIIVYGNAQDGVANTMNQGEIVIFGNAGDIVGHSMRGGKIFIQKDVGYRVGIHMKAYKEFFPVIVVGGKAGDFLGEYMAGGLLIILGLENDSSVVGDFVGTGMHGGRIFIRGEIDSRCLGKEVKIAPLTDEDLALLKKYVGEFCRYFNMDLKTIFKKSFVKLYPYTHRPYGKLYAY